MKTLIILAGGLACAACSTPLDAPLSPTFGQAVASMQSQIIPAPVSLEAPEGSGAVGAAAIARMERGERRKLETQGTSDLQAGAASSAGAK